MLVAMLISSFALIHFILHGKPSFQYYMGYETWKHGEKKINMKTPPKKAISWYQNVMCLATKLQSMVLFAKGHKAKYFRAVMGHLTFIFTTITMSGSNIYNDH